MANFNVYSTAQIDTLLGPVVVGGTIDGSSHLQLATKAGGTIDAGSVAAPLASTTVVGSIQLATTTEATAGTDTAKAVTAAGVKAVANTLQPNNTNLTTIAAITPVNDSVMQVKSGVWSIRTLAQLMTDLVATGSLPQIHQYTTSAYPVASGAMIFAGPAAQDPVTVFGSAPNGSVWYQTS